MKTLNSILRWAPLYVLVGILLAALIWEERLQINPSDHTLLAAGFLVIFFLLVNTWIDFNEAYFLAIHYEEIQKEKPAISYFLSTGIPSEEKQ